MLCHKVLMLIKIYTKNKFLELNFQIISKKKLYIIKALPGKTTYLLWDAGYLSPEAVKNSHIGGLLKIKGIEKIIIKNPKQERIFI